MDNNPPGPVSTIIGNLRILRDRMSTLVDAQESLNRKLAGPRPDPPKSNQPQDPNCVMSLFAEINILLLQLEDVTEAQHLVMGAFTPDGNQIHAAQSRGY